MTRAPAFITGLLTAATVAALGALATDPAPYSSSIAVLLAAGLVIATVIAVSGLLIARGRWALPAVVVAALVSVATGTIVETAWGVPSILLGAGAVAGVAGPWLGRWLRRLPSAQGPPPEAAAMLLLLTWGPLVLSMPGPEGAVVARWSLSAWALALALVISRAVPVARAASRIAHPVATAATIPFLPVAVAAAAAIWGLATTGLAWRRSVGVALAPLDPRAAETIRFPPELTPREVLHDAGLDDSGRPRGSET